MGSIGIIFILLYLLFISIPCVGAAWIGCRLIDRLGRFPSKTPAVQMGALLQIAILEIVSFTLLLGFFKVLVAE